MRFICQSFLSDIGWLCFVGPFLRLCVSWHGSGYLELGDHIWTTNEYWTHGLMLNRVASFQKLSIFIMLSQVLTGDGGELGCAVKESMELRSNICYSTDPSQRATLACGLAPWQEDTRHHWRWLCCYTQDMISFIALNALNVKFPELNWYVWVGCSRNIYCKSVLATPWESPYTLPYWLWWCFEMRTRSVGQRAHN